MATRGRAAVTWQGTRAALARASAGNAARPTLDATVIDVPADADGTPSLAELRLADVALAGVPLSTVLPGSSYQLLLEEMPNAPRAELRQAIGWRIRERINTPLEDAVIELLEMPAQARAGSKASAYAVVAKRSHVQAQVDCVRGAGLALDTIDLPELCMRNIAVRLPQDRDGVAFLHFTREGGLLTITRQGVLYLIRRIEAGQSQLDQSPRTQVQTSLIPAICLELQRSLDYYETNYDLPAISELVLGPGADSEPLIDGLREQLGLRVSPLDLAELFDLQRELDEEAQSECLFAIGAALRHDGG